MIFAQHPPLPSLSQTGIRVLASSYSEELRRPIVLLMMLSSFMIFLPYSGILVWTSRALTGIYDPVVVSMLLLLAGIVAFIIGISMGRIIKRIGIIRTILTGLSALFIGVIILLFAGDITAPDNLLLVVIALPIAGIAGGSLNTVVTSYSQRISPTRRGVLAGLVTATQFIGAAIVPSIYEPFFNTGISMVYLAILFVSIILAILLILLQKFASKVLQNNP
jgi:MFS family permease